MRISTDLFRIALCILPCGWLAAAPAAAQSIVTDGLEAAYAFDTISGDAIADASGNGRDGSVNGTYEWEGDALHLIEGSSYGWASIPRDGMMANDWTVDMWVDSRNNGENGAGRVFSASTEIGGTGPEFFFRSGKVAMRINNNGATWNTPRVGSRSNSGPPDHWALPAEQIAFNTLWHIVVTHDKATKTVKMYHARATESDLRLVFDGDYSGTANMTVSDLRLSQSHEGGQPRYLDATWSQLMIYDRVLDQAEAEQNHDAGQDSLSIQDVDEDGVPDGTDNCLELANANQRDTNGDGIGNACDPDLDGDCTVNFSDLGAMKSVFFSADADADLNGDGTVDFVDLAALKAVMYGVPGPSGAPNGCDGS